jgi:site-specific recombinase XerD
VTHLIAAGENVRVVQEMAGPRSLATTARHAGVEDDQKQHAANTLDPDPVGQ